MHDVLEETIRECDLAELVSAPKRSPATIMREGGLRSLVRSTEPLREILATHGNAGAGVRRFADLAPLADEYAGELEPAERWRLNVRLWTVPAGVERTRLGCWLRSPGSVGATRFWASRGGGTDGSHVGCPAADGNRAPAVRPDPAEGGLGIRIGDCAGGRRRATALIEAGRAEAERALSSVAFETYLGTRKRPST
jgi:hypothetical protein